MPHMNFPLVRDHLFCMPDHLSHVPKSDLSKVVTPHVYVYSTDFHIVIVQENQLSTYLKGDTKSVLIIRGTCYQGWFMYMRYTQRQNE